MVFLSKRRVLETTHQQVETAFVVGAVFRVWGLVTISFEVGRGGNLSVLSSFFFFLSFFFFFVY